MASSGIIPPSPHPTSTTPWSVETIPSWAHFNPALLSSLSTTLPQLLTPPVQAGEGVGGVGWDEAAERVSKVLEEHPEAEPFIRSFLTDVQTVQRFGQARGWKVEAVVEAILGAVEYFSTTRTWQLRSLKDSAVVEKMQLEGATGKVYRHGWDREGRPCLYLRDARQNTKNYPEHVQFVKWTLNGAIASMDKAAGVSQWTLLFDFKGRSVSNTPPLSVAKEVLDCFQAYYPERLAKAFLLDAPWLFWAFWKAISVFIDKRTAEKIVFVNSPDFTPITDWVHPDELEEDFGGNRTSKWDQETYWKAELECVRKEDELRDAAHNPATEEAADVVSSSGKRTRRKVRKK